MGNTPSAPKPIAAPSPVSREQVFNEKLDYYSINSKLRGLQLDDTYHESSNPISIDSLDSWESKLLSDPKNKLAQAAITSNSIDKVVSKTNVKLTNTDKFLFNVEVDVVGSPSFFNNQKSLGRCWIFATCNVLRSHVIKNYNLSPEKFQLSQSYLFFYDKLEKANFFLDNILDTVDEDLDSRLVNHLLRDPISDGGQWDMIVNLVSKYGLVPQEVFPDLINAQASSGLNGFLVSKLREYGFILRKLVKDGESPAQVGLVKQSMMKQVYNIIAIALGSPPKPTDSFKWEFIDKDGNYKSFQTTPLDFYTSHVRFDAAKQFSLLNDPRNEYGKLYTVDRLKNISDGKPIEYVNLEISTLKKVAIKMLQKNEPIFFGSDVSKFLSRETGILDVDAFDYDLGFGTSLKLNKEERVRVGNSAMNHAMVITGVHLDETTKAPIRWKIENSWGDETGDKGYYLMTDKWFDEYVFQIVTNKSFVDKEVYNIWKNKDYTTLPYYDPMGSLA